MVTNPTAPARIATGRPPGTRITPAPAGSRCRRIIDAKTSRKGMSVQMTVMLTRMSYAPFTVWPAWPRTMQTPIVAPRVRRATCGVRHFGWRRPKLSGR